MTTAQGLLEEHYKDCPEPTWFDRYVTPIVIGSIFVVPPILLICVLVMWLMQNM